MGQKRGREERESWSFISFLSIPDIPLARAFAETRVRINRVRLITGRVELVRNSATLNFTTPGEGSSKIRLRLEEGKGLAWNFKRARGVGSIGDWREILPRGIFCPGGTEKFQIPFEFANDKRFVVTPSVFSITSAEISVWPIIKRGAIVARKRRAPLEFTRRIDDPPGNNVISLTDAKIVSRRRLFRPIFLPDREKFERSPSVSHPRFGYFVEICTRT